MASLTLPTSPAVGCAVDVEGVEGDVPPVPRTHYASRQGGSEEWGERSPAGLVGDGSLTPRKLRVGEAGVVHSQGEEDFVAHVFLVPPPETSETTSPKHQVAEVRVAGALSGNEL